MNGALLVASSEIAVDDVLQLALVIAKPDEPALLIDAENNHPPGQLVSVETAHRKGYTYAVTVADNILALDGDAARARAAGGLAGELVHETVEPMLVASGRPGNVHLFARIPDPALFAHFKARARALGGHPDNFVRRVIRPPLSPHRLGLPVRLMYPADVHTALAGLMPSRRPPLSAEMEYVLASGLYRRGPDRSRSAMIQALAVAFVNAGATEEQFYAEIIAGSAGEKVRERRGDRARRAYVHDTWTKAEAFAQRRPVIRHHENARRFVAHLRDAAAGVRWCSHLDHVVLDALHTIALTTGKVTISASVRDLAERAGCDKDTVPGVLMRLRTDGWIRLHEPARRVQQKAATWTLLLPEGSPRGVVGLPDIRILVPASQVVGLPDTLTASLGACASTACRQDSSPADASHDLWRHPRAGGLGKAALATWRVLSPLTPVRTGKVARLTGRTRGVARHQLHRLTAQGLAIPAPGGGWLRGPSDVDLVARTLGVAGKRKDQLARHKRDREAHRRGLTERGLACPAPHRVARV